MSKSLLPISGLLLVRGGSITAAISEACDLRSAERHRLAITLPVECADEKGVVMIATDTIRLSLAIFFLIGLDLFFVNEAKLNWRTSVVILIAYFALEVAFIAPV